MNLHVLFATTFLLISCTHFFIWWLRRDAPLLIQIAYTFAIALSGFFLLLIVKAVASLNDYLLLIVAILYGIFMYDGAFKRSIIESDEKLAEKNRK